MKIYVVPDPNETKFQRLKREAKARCDEIKDWISRNKEAVIILTPVVIGGVTTIIKVVGKLAELRVLK